MVLFSCIIPTFNRAALLGMALDSLFQQRFAEFEIIVVDDGSTNSTSAYLQSLGNRVKVLYQPNRGPGAARNLGARDAQGQYLAFLDSDDLFFPWTLDIYRDAIQKFSNPSFLIGKSHVFSNMHELTNVVFSPARTEHFADYLASGNQSGWRGASAFVIRRDTFVRIGGFTDARVNLEDADLTMRLGTASGFTQITAPVTFAAREHAGSAWKDQKRTYAGAILKVHAERTGSYPGGKARAAERRRILTRHTRAATIGFLQTQLWLEAWMLYRSTFVWNASLGRAKYLGAFPVLATILRVHSLARRILSRASAMIGSTSITLSKK